MEEAFNGWRDVFVPTPPMELLRVEDGCAIIGVRNATMSLGPVEGGSFFAEGLGDFPDALETWLAEVNSHMADTTTVSFVDALGLLARHLPLASEASEDDGMDTEDDDVDELEIEMGAERAADRAAFSEDQKWEGIVVSSTCQGSRQASQVLMREMRMLLHLQGEGKGEGPGN